MVLLLLLLLNTVAGAGACEQPPLPRFCSRRLLSTLAHACTHGKGTLIMHTRAVTRTRTRGLCSALVAAAASFLPPWQHLSNRLGAHTNPPEPNLCLVCSGRARVRSRTAVLCVVCCVLWKVFNHVYLPAVPQHTSYHTILAPMRFFSPCTQSLAPFKAQHYPTHPLGDPQLSSNVLGACSFAYDPAPWRARLGAQHASNPGRPGPTSVTFEKVGCGRVHCCRLGGGRRLQLLPRRPRAPFASAPQRGAARRAHAAQVPGEQAALLRMPATTSTIM